MTENALGYIAEPRGLPGGLILRPASDIWLVAGPSQGLKTERQRLTALQSCFDIGVDIAPLAPKVPICATVAEDYAGLHRSDLLGILTKLSGQGQLTLSFPKPSPPRNPTDDGQAWLKMRKDQRAQTTALLDWLDHLASQTGLPIAPGRETARSLSTSLLVPRNQQMEVVARLRAALRESPAAPAFNGRLSISGLWPAFSFASLWVSAGAEYA